MPYEGIRTNPSPIKKPKSDFIKKWNKISTEVMHRTVAAFPICLVNGVAVIGQLSWAHDHLQAWHTAGQILFAFALESIALFLSYSAYLAEKENDSALRLKMASYMIGFGVGILNYNHFSNDWHPTAVAIVVGMMSSLSPMLWAVYSRRVSRPILAKNGLIDEHALRLGASRWFWHPIRSAQVMYMATWIGENKVSRAIAIYEKLSAEREASKLMNAELEKINAENGAN